MKVRKTRTYLQKLIFLEVLIFLVIGVWYFNRIQDIQNQANKEKLIDIANGIENYFLKTLAVTESIMLKDSKKIQNLDVHNYNNVLKVISDFENNKLVTDLLGWTSLRWYDFQTNKIVIDSNVGILKDPIEINLEQRYYLKRTLTKHNVLFIGEPLSGAISGQPKIPFGMGVADKDGKYLGTMLGGYSIEKFKDGIATTYKYDQIISFAIFNKEGTIIVDSNDSNISVEEIKAYSKAIRDSRNINLVENSEVKSPFSSLIIEKEIVKRVAQLPLYIIVKINPPALSLSYLDSIKKSLYDLAVIMLAFASLVAFIRITLLKPLMRLSRNAQKIALDSKNIEFKNYSTHELAILSDALKKVVEQKFALSDANQKLEFLAQKAQIASNAKSDFIRNLQHEFRTPLNHILGSAEVLLSKAKSSQDKEYLGMISKSGKELLENINKVIEVADFEAGKVKLREVQISAQALIETALSQVYSRLSLKSIKIIKAYDPKLPEILVDEEKFVRALVCIFDNSITFALDKASQIIIKVYTQHSRLIISIADNGLGIKEDDLERITQAFESSGNVLTKFHRGIGLGLTIVKSVLELHDADLSISSQEGIGTEIVISLPKFRTIK